MRRPHRQRGERGADPWIELRSEDRHHQPSQPVPRVAQLGIAAVKGEGDAPIGEEVAHVGARAREQRPQQPPAGGPHGAEPATSRAA
jgi:hypothetical protein